MKKYIELSPIEIQLGFVASCIESVANKLQQPYINIYRRLKKANLLEQYIFRHYDALHTESRENITNDIIACLAEREN